MPDWSISPVSADDIDDFVECEFVAFVGNTLHDIVYPSHEAAVKAHRKNLEEGLKLPPGNETVYLKAVDNDTSKIVGGIKFLIYGNEDVRTNSPYAAAISELDSSASDVEQYRGYIINEFLGKRVRDIQGQHARKSLAKA